MTDQIKQRLIIAAAFAAGVFVSHVDRIFHQQDTPITTPINESYFGWADVAADHPHCQTDMTYSDQWSPRLMYLNGLWTAACVAEAYRQEIDND